ncbi:unnamed protein product [Nippostrongylus brasiliensis]|uniref:Uncharacterized protein n=1 Tax=Nippostrongylus brasiliensis TaxID=27835 RepID=A0A0N4XXV3_NIPBR|nr:unnamed protein product [Nippostrongylus brasiliensis]
MRLMRILPTSDNCLHEIHNDIVLSARERGGEQLAERKGSHKHFLVRRKKRKSHDQHESGTHSSGIEHHFTVKNGGANPMRNELFLFSLTLNS